MCNSLNTSKQIRKFTKQLNNKTMKVLKIEKDENSEWFSVLIKDKKIEVWIDVCQIADNFEVDWNMYIFDNRNEHDMTIKAYQENCDNFEKCSSLAIETVERELNK